MQLRTTDYRESEYYTPVEIIDKVNALMKSLTPIKDVRDNDVLG